MGKNVIEVIKIWYKYIVDIIPFWIVKVKNIFCVSILLNIHCCIIEHEFGIS